MNTMKKMVLAFLASVCTGAAVAATAELSIRRTDGTYDFFNPKIWSTQAVPGTGDTAILAICQPAKLIKLQLTQDFSAALTGGLVYLTQASTEFQFDGDGHVLEMPESEAGDYATPPFYVTYAWNNWFVLKSNPAATSAKAVLKWTNPVFSVRTDENEKSFLVFQNGEYDFGSTRDLYVGLASYVTDVSFLEGSKLKAGSLYITPNQNVANSCSMTFSNAVASVVGLAINNGGSVRLTGDETAALTLSDDLAFVISIRSDVAIPLLDSRSVPHI